MRIEQRRDLRPEVPHRFLPRLEVKDGNAEWRDAGMDGRHQGKETDRRKDLEFGDFGFHGGYSQCVKLSALQGWGSAGKSSFFLPVANSASRNRFNCARGDSARPLTVVAAAMTI